MKVIHKKLRRSANYGPPCSLYLSMIRWMCGVKLNERKKSEELRELLGLEPVSSVWWSKE